MTEKTEISVFHLLSALFPNVRNRRRKDTEILQILQILGPNPAYFGQKTGQAPAKCRDLFDKWSFRIALPHDNNELSVAPDADFSLHFDKKSNMQEGYLVTFDFSKGRQPSDPQWIEWNGKRIFEAIV